MSAKSSIEPPTYELERELAAGGAGLVAGIDEVGRGAWAGPVVVCAAVTDGSEPPEGLTDSKRLSPKRRITMSELVRPWVRDHAFGRAEPTEIDEVGMTEALRRAAGRALAGLARRPDAVILDGKHDYLGRPWAVRTRIKADLTCVSVAAASVLAKVHRDAFMAGLDPEFPGYGFGTAAGYPSPVHRAALAEHGPTPHHRMSWAYLDDLPKWRHLRKVRPAAGDQLSIL
ncbi:ribonuclease HII [Spinactinospora alkalitolerans]|uniref:Ribonuclease HII n=1 Tax=Spinactinospora alkalitolerans TaxID=687207 RepID=A0A852TWH2_9ACTN|nr:ribonuclease HII [Spinactinospora alkalitolerans]NYE46424.1 ribonuclease HII [Spinactinospora alkalitolerans]